MSHHFISYSSADARDFAARLADDLRIGARSFNTWLDVNDIPSGEDWDEQIAEGIRTCESLIFVMTEDSVKANSVCKNEWTWALKYKKPITPLRLHAAAELPFRLASRDYIDFSSDFATGLAELRKRLHWLSTPAGQLQALKHRLLDAERDLLRSHDNGERQTIEEEIALLQRQIDAQEQTVAAPYGAAGTMENRTENYIKQPFEQDIIPTSSINLHYEMGSHSNQYQIAQILFDGLRDQATDDCFKLISQLVTAHSGTLNINAEILWTALSDRLTHWLFPIESLQHKETPLPSVRAALLTLVILAWPSNKVEQTQQFFTECRTKLAKYPQSFDVGNIYELLEDYEDLLLEKNIKDAMTWFS